MLRNHAIPVFILPNGFRLLRRRNACKAIRAGEVMTVIKTHFRVEMIRGAFGLAGGADGGSHFFHG